MHPSRLKKSLPLLVDALPLYASRAQIVAVLTTDPREQKMAEQIFNWQGFPRPSALLGGLYFVPAVVDFITEYEARRQSGLNVGGRQLSREEVAHKFKSTAKRESGKDPR